MMPTELKHVVTETGEIRVAIIEGCDGPLMIMKINVKGEKGSQRVFALLDGGASRSLIKKSLAEKLGITGEKVDYRYSGVTGDTVLAKNAMKVNFKVSGDYRGAPILPLHNAMTVDEIRMRPYTFNLDEAKKHWPHLKQVQGQNLVKVVPDVIIGNNNPHLTLPRKVLQGALYNPVGIRTVLGWTVAGNFEGLPELGVVNSFNGNEGSDDYLHDLIKQSFSLDQFGVKVPSEKGLNLEEKRSYRILDETARQTNSRWEVGLLWRNDNVQFPESYNEAYRRLLSTERRMQKDPVFKETYISKIAEYLEKGYLRKLLPEELNVKNPKAWILPHFGVLNENKPGKFRLVMDAKAKSNGLSLNDKLLKGPDLLQPLVKVLLNFRLHAVAITGDITDMFHRVLVRKEDQISQQILWREGDQTKEPSRYVMSVMIFGATSSPSSATFIKNKNASLFTNKYPEASTAIVENMYVDDMLYSVSTVENAIRVRKEVTDIMEAGGFVIRKWMSNRPEVIESIPLDLRADGVKYFEEHCELPTERVLGLWWNPEHDEFVFRLNLNKMPHEVQHGARPTKREVCSLVMSLYDPLGFINHFKVKGMMILQNIWRSGVSWDDEISSVDFDTWKKWVSQLNQIKEVQIPRMYSNLLENSDTIELHTFCDSSEESFCAICYLRFQKGEQVDTAFVTSKVRVAPLKKTTIPRLELQAALLGSRIANSVNEALEIKLTGRRFHTDSSTVLQWIRSSSHSFKEFVANRVGEIQETTEVAEWRWVPTAVNTADIATRFNGDISFHPEDKWFTGPDFLKQPEESWPKERQQNNGIIASVIAESVGNDTLEVDNWDCIPTPTRFSSYIRLVRATASVRACGRFWLSKCKFMGSEANSKANMKITLADILDAERKIMSAVQKDCFQPEFELLEKGKSLTKKSKLYKFCPVLCKGVLKVHGRIGAADVDNSVKAPVILPSRHHVTDLIIDREHQHCAHQGKETVFTNLRKTFWITDGRQAVKRAWMRCQQCKLKRAKPVIPLMGDLPQYRLASYQPPFTFTGLDCFGPLEVSVGRRREKRWGVIFCCMVTRAVNLEVIHNMSTDEMLLAISRFVDVRGRPSTFISDNGTNFVGASNEMKKALQNVDFEAISRHGKFHRIDWQFNPPSAPHMGGAWERLVQSVKKCLSTVLREKAPKDTTLLTCFKGVENILNSRPITYVSSDVHDPEPLCPNHFLRGGVDVGPGIPVSLDASDEFLRSQWKRAQVFIDQFWRRWTNEYLPKLLRRGNWQSPCEPIKIGELVYIVDDNAPRNTWTRGVITQVFPGKDGQVRVVEVTTANKDGKKNTYRRPTCKVCPLGLQMEIQE